MSKVLKWTIALAILGAISVTVVVALWLKSVVVDLFYYRPGQETSQADWDRTIRHYSLILLFRPKDGSAYDWRGYAHERKGEWDDAIGDFNTALRLNPGDTWALNNRGFAYAGKGDFDKAIADYTQGLRIGGPEANLLVSRGTAYGQRGDLEKAVADLDEALRLEPDNARTYIFRGVAYCHASKFDEALEDFNEAIQRNPTSEAYTYRGMMYMRQGDWVKAISDHRRALTSAEEPADAHNSLAWLLATAPDSGVRDGVEALALATKACELTRWKHSHCIDTLAAAYAEAGNFQEAVKFQKQALALLPKSSRDRSGMEKRLKLYEEHRAYRSEAGTSDD